MRRLLLLLVVMGVVWAAGATPALAQGAGMPDYPAIEQPGWGGPGYYLSWVKILACWGVFLGWVWTTDWVSRDAQAMKLDYLRWNPIVVGVFLLAMVLVWLGIPYFWLAFPLLLAAYAGPLTAYVIYRNKKVLPHQMVMTRDHLRHWFSARAAIFGVKVEAEKKAAYEKGTTLAVEPRGGTEQEGQSRLIAARQHQPGFNIARKTLADGLDRRADTMVLDYTQQAVGVRYQIDGVWHNGEPVPREEGDPSLEALKMLCGLKADDRQGKQEGAFAAVYKAVKHEAAFASQGTKTGERVVVKFELKQTLLKTLDDLGMRPKVQEALKEVLSREKGFVLLSAMPAAGLRTTTTVVLRSLDRLMREFMAIEDGAGRYEEVENIPVTTYNAAEGQSPATVLIKVIRLEPQVIVVRDLVNAETVAALCDDISEEDRVVVSTIRAKDCAEALLRVLAMGEETRPFVEQVTGVLNQRLIRKLCDKCKQAYQPTPQVLQQLRIPAGRVQAFYRTPQPTEENPNPEPCDDCNGIGFKGRTALLEFWTIGENVRNVLATSPKLDLLRQAARKDGMRTLQEEGVLLVAKGVTSLPELMRVLKL